MTSPPKMVLEEVKIGAGVVGGGYGVGFHRSWLAWPPEGDGPLFGDLQQAAAQGELGIARAGPRAVGPFANIDQSAKSGEPCR